MTEPAPADRLDAVVDQEIRNGGRLESYTSNHAVIVYGSGNVLLHITFAVLTLFTCGLFLFPWIVWANTIREQRPADAALEETLDMLAQCCGPGLDLPICVTPCRVARMNTRKDILTMPGNHAHEYVGRHRKPEHDPKDPPTDTSLHRAYELFTHGTQPIHITKEK